MIVCTAVSPKLQDSARCGNESTPAGVHKEVRHTAVSNLHHRQQKWGMISDFNLRLRFKSGAASTHIRNFEPSARKAINTAGSSRPGQKKDL